MYLNISTKFSTGILVLFLNLILLLTCAGYSFSSTPAGYSEYYIPGDETNMEYILNTLDLGLAATPKQAMHAVITVTAWSANTTIYYDHWEYGYEFDPANPDANIVANGGHVEKYVLSNPGDQQVFESSNIPTNPRGTAQYYDGGDHIYVAGGAVTVTRAGWIEATGVGNQAVAWEIYPVKPQLTTYVLPFGENLGATIADFSRVFVLVQATADNTVVSVDRNGDGVADTLDLNRDGTCGNPGDAVSVTLNRGETFLLDNVSNCGAINTGVVINGTETLQVKYIAGQERNPPGWMARGFSVFPRGYWTKDYYAPMDNEGGNSDYYLYNPNTSPITVEWRTLVSSGSFTIPAGQTVSYRAIVGAVPTGSGIYFKGSDIFWGVGSADAGSYIYEWGYSLLPSTMIYDEHFLGWAPDCYPVSAGCTDNGIFLIPAQDNTRVFIDINNDGIVDQTYLLNRLQMQYITAPSGDLSKAHIWATGPFSMAYGQNGGVNMQAPAMDLGYVAIPASDFVSLVLTVDKSVNPQVVPTASGSTAAFTIKVNSQKYTLNTVDVTDLLPPNWEYVTGTTTIVKPDKTTSSSDPMVTGVPATGQTLFWTSADLGTDGTPGMAENQEVTITFTARTTIALATGTLSQNRVQAVGTRTFGVPSQTQTFTATDFAYVASGDFTVEKTSNAENPLYPGDTFTYTVTVTNPSATASLTGISILDPIPAGVSYVAGSSQVTAWMTTIQTDNVRDNFSVQAYSNNDGSVNWVGNWVESDGTQNAGAGNVQIVGGELRLGSTSNIYRQVDLSDPSITSATLTLDYRTVNLDNPDTTTFEICTSPTGSCTTVLTFGNDRTGTVNYTIPANRRTSTTTIRFIAGGYNGTNEYLYVDNVDISYTYPVGSYGTNPAGDAPDFVSSSDGYTLGPGQTLELTYAVTVDNPLASGISEITNTAYVNSSEIILPLSSSVTDYVVNPSSGSAEVGDRVWLDVDGDGVQDPGEPGLSNVEVTLKDQFGTPIMTTLTDSTGHYLFTGVMPGNGYYVEAAGGTIPSGLVQSAPAGHSDNKTDAFDISNLLYLGNSRDQFDNVAYNNSDGTMAWDGAWTESDAGGAGPGTGYIQVSGGRLQINNDSGVTTQSISRGVDLTGTGATSAILTFDYATSGNLEDADVIYVQYRTGGGGWTTFAGGTYTNDVAGSATFTIPLASPAGLTEIRFAITSASAYTSNNEFFYIDNVNIAFYSETPLENYLNADLGYKPVFGTAVIGRYVWSDADGNGLRDAGEPGIAGVTVELYSDNGDGVFDSLSDTQVSTAITAADGTYLFSGVPPGNYFVYVNVGQATLSGYSRTGPSDDPFYLSGLNSGDVVTYANFGYRNPSNLSITDRVWFDSNGNGAYDGGESGISGVTVDLLDASLNVIATTTTDIDGYFTFSGVIGGGADYRIRITDMNGVLTDYFGTTPEAIAGSWQENNLTVSRSYTSSPHFGYDITRSIGDTVFNDVNGNGTQDTGEAGISGVTVLLYRDDGDNIFEPGADDGSPVATATTDSNGRYIFSGLSDGTYWVSIDNTQSALSPFNVLTTADDSGVAGHQRRVTISGGISDLGIDYGYRSSTSYSASGTIWEDTNSDGLMNNGEAGIGGVTIDLLNNGGVVIATTFTDGNGYYSFSGLPAGNYQVRVTDASGVLSGYTTTYETDSNFDGYESFNFGGGSIANLNFGYNSARPTLVVLSSFRTFEDRGRLVVEWITSSEIDTVGFYLYRLDDATGKYVRINHDILPGLITWRRGGVYRLIDTGAQPDGTYTYVLVERQGRGPNRRYGPFTVRAGQEAIAGMAGSAAAELPGRCTGGRCTGKRKGTPIVSYYDDQGSLNYTNIKNERVVEEDRGKDLYSGYTRKPKGMSEAGKSRLSKMRAERAVSAETRERRKGPWAKISVTSDGLYYMSASAIANLFGKSSREVERLIGENRLTLQNMGKNVAYLAAESSAGIYFFGRHIDSLYTNDNIYWLGRGKGRRMGSVSGGWPDPVGGGSFTEHLRIEQNKWMIPNLSLDPEADLWIWDWVFAFPFSFPDWDTRTFDNILIDGPAAAPAAATLEVHLQAFVDDPLVDPDQHVVVSLNGTILAPADPGSDRWDGLDAYTVKYAIDQSTAGLLLDGDNTIIVQGVGDLGSEVSGFYINSFDLTYRRLYRAENNELIFKPESDPVVTVYGFSNPDIMVLDVTDPDGPKLVNPTRVSGAAGNYSVTLSTGGAGKTFLAVSSGGIVTNPKAWADVPSRLSVWRNRADYIVIAPNEFKNEAQGLADYRKSGGLEIMVVDPEDIMDEFNYGISSPKAIQNFLKYAYGNWQKVPKYVVIGGEGTYDYKDNMGYGDNLVPPLLASTPEGVYASDNLFGDVNGDHIPKISVGRLSVATPDEFTAVIDKIKAYEASSGNCILFLSDDPDDAGNFPLNSDYLASLVTAQYSTKKIYLSEMPLAAAKAGLVSSLNGAECGNVVLANYIGHGDLDCIGRNSLYDEGLLCSGYLGTTMNWSAMPVLTALTCVAGDFSGPGTDSLGESLLLNSRAGGVAFWASTGLSENEFSTVLAEGFFRGKSLAGPGGVLGDLILGAMEWYRSKDLPLYEVDIHNLQGDPALRLR